MKISNSIILLVLIIQTENLFSQVVCNQCAIANPINNGLVACYPFNGNSQDQSGFSNHGTNYGATLTTDRFGNPNSAYYFNGSTYIYVPNSASLSTPTSSSTIAFWAYTTSWSTWFGINYGSILSKSNSATTCNYRVSLIATGISGIINNKIWDYFIGTNGLNQWDFFVVTMNGNTLSYYKNGVLIGQNSSPSAFSLSTNNPLYIGRDDPGFIDYYTGKIDDIRIYNRVLNYSEVISLYNYKSTLNANAGLDKNICIGDSIQLSGNGGPKLNWNNPQFLSNDTISNPFTRTNITRDYILTVTDGICEDKDTVRVNITPKPNVIATGLTTICKGDSVQLSVSGANKYLWNNGVFLNNDTIFNPIAKLITNISFIVTGYIGTCSNKDTISINLVSITPDAGLDQSICVGGSAQLIASGGTKYEWLSNNTLNDTSIYNPIAKPIINTKYYVLVSNGVCKQKMDSVVVFITNNLITNAGIDVSLCENDSVQLFGSGGNTFTWNPSIGLSQNDVPNPYARPKTTTQYILKSVSGICTSEDTIIITVNEIPKLDLGLDKTICIGETYLVNATSNADKFTWNPAQFLNNSSVKNPNIKPDNYIKYIVKAENSQTNCFVNDTLKIYVNIPKANFLTSTSSGKKPLTILFKNNSLPVYINSFWTFGNTENSNLFNPKTIYTKAGKFSVKLLVTDSIGCKDSAFKEITVYDDLIVSIPNAFTPNNDILNDFFILKVSDISQVVNIKGSIWNRWGEMIYEYSYPINNGWDGTNNGIVCSEGVYLYVFEVETIYNESFKYHGTVTLIR
ncbi:MAG: LamG-like jellyroll fold domain-containing protein [Bacteroidia bacterium]